MAEGDLMQIIILGAVAVFLALRLRGVLGRRTGEERTPTRDPFAAPDAQPRRAESGQVLPGPRGDAASPSDLGAPSSLAGALTQIKIMEPGFEEKNFLNGARAAFGMIVEAFAKGDLATLKPLLSRDMYDAFAADVRDRENQGLKRETHVERVRVADIERARLVGSTAYVTVRFVSDQVDFTRDRDGKLVEGSDEHGVEVTDVWTFSRDLRSRDPNWLLSETHPGEV